MARRSPDATPGPPSPLAAWLAGHPALVAGLAAALAQVNTLRNEPVLDDGWVIFENPLVRNIANAGRIVRDPYNVAGAATNAGLWRPFTTLTYALNHLAGGADVTGYHLVNALLHVAVTLLVVALARRVVAACSPGREGVAALAAGVLFAVHPVHVEAVAGLVGRAELLAAGFALGAVLLAATREVAPWRLPAAALATALGVLSKENAAIAPALLALVVLLAPGSAGLPARPGLAAGAPRQALSRAAVAVAALAAGALVPFLLRPVAFGVTGGASWFAGRPPGVVAATMSRALAEYLRLLAWPHPLGVDFHYAQKIPFTPWGAPASLLAALVWGGVLLAGLASGRTAPVRALGILWIFVALVPVSNLVPTGVLMAERLLYLPSAGFCLWIGHAAATGLEAAGRRGPAAARGVAVAAAGVAVLLLGLTLSRNRDWRDGLSLWSAEVVTTPRDPVVNNNLAVALTGAGRYDEARARLAVALESAPRYWRAWVNLGIVEHRAGTLGEALAAFRRASAIDPSASSPHLFAGIALADAGRLEEAERRLSEAARLAPEEVWARIHRGEVLARLGRREEARDEYDAALRLDPRSGAARRGRAGLDVVDSTGGSPRAGPPPR